MSFGNQDGKATPRTLIVVAGLVILFFLIAIPNYLTIGEKSPDTRAKEKLRYACFTAKQMFELEPERKTVELDDLKRKDFILSPDIELVIVDGRRDAFRMSAKHRSGKNTFFADKDGNITSLR